MVFTATKPIAKKDINGQQSTIVRNSQLVIGELKPKTGLAFEKSIDLESYFCQSCVGLEQSTTTTNTISTNTGTAAAAASVVILGCSDGFVRLFSLETNSMVLAERLHHASVLNLVVRKNQTLISLSAESIKHKNFQKNVFFQPIFQPNQQSKFLSRLLL